VNGGAAAVNGEEFGGRRTLAPTGGDGGRMDEKKPASGAG